MATARPNTVIRNRYLWVAVIVASVALVTSLLVVTANRSDPAGDLRSALDARLLTAVEQTEPEQHQGHGEHVGQAGEGPLVCGVRVFGFEPANAATVAEVRDVYGYHLCAVAEQGRPWDWAVKLVGPVVLRLTTEPPTIEVAEPTATANFTERVRELFPDEYEDEALNESLGADRMARLRERYEDAAGL